MKEQLKEEKLTQEIPKFDENPNELNKDNQNQDGQNQDNLNQDDQNQKNQKQKNQKQKDQNLNENVQNENDQNESVRNKNNANSKVKENSVRKKLKKLVIAAVIVTVLLAAAVYVGIGVYYQTHFLPCTTVSGIDCSGMEAAQAAEIWDARIESYVLEIKGRDPFTGESGAVLGTITPSQIQLSYADTLKTMEQIMAQQEWLLWIRALAGQKNDIMFEQQGVIYNEALLKSLVKNWSAFQSQNMIVAQNAYISDYSESLQGYEVIPEIRGTELDVEQAILLVEKAILSGEGELDLEAAGIYVEPEIQQNDASLTDPVETANRWLSTSITYDWSGNEVLLDAETLHEWISIQDGQAVLNEEAVNSFVKEQARKYDTYGKIKSFVTTAGINLSLTSASYGWRTDRDAETEELLQLIQEGTNISREPLYTHRGMVKAADKVNDIGNSYVEADLTNQHLYLYYNGELVLETDFVSGKISNGNGTPPGVFGITYKKTDAVLRGEGYATPVKYWMPFYGDFGMHDAKWRKEFGGDIYLSNGSHGCINLPPSMAEQIYQYVSKGFPVICYYYEVPVVPDDAAELPDPETTAPETEGGQI